MNKDLNSFIHSLKISKNKLSMENDEENSKKLKLDLIEKIDILENKINNVVNNLVEDLLYGPSEINFEKPRIIIKNDSKNIEEKVKKQDKSIEHINRIVKNVVKNKNFKISSNKLLNKEKKNVKNKKIIKNKLTKPLIILPKEIRNNPFAYLHTINKELMDIGAINLLQIGVIPRDIDAKTLINLNNPILQSKKVYFNDIYSKNLSINKNIDINKIKVINYSKNKKITSWKKLNSNKNIIKIKSPEEKNLKIIKIKKIEPIIFNMKEYIIKIIQPNLEYKNKKIILNDEIFKYIYNKETRINAFYSLIKYLEFILNNIFPKTSIQLNLSEICSFSLFNRFPKSQELAKFIKPKHYIKIVEDLDFYINYNKNLVKIIYIQSKIRQLYAKRLFYFKKKIINFAYRIQNKFNNLILKQKFKMENYKNKIKMIEQLKIINKKFLENYEIDVDDDEIIEIHLNSFYLGRFKKKIYDLYNNFENLGIYNIFRAFNNKKIIYLYNKEIIEKNLENLFNIFEINEKLDKLNNIFLLYPENYKKLEKNKLCLSNLVYYSPELLNNIKNIIANKKAYIITNSKPTFFDYNIANYLQVPIFPISFNLPVFESIFNDLNLQNILNIKKLVPDIDNFYLDLTKYILESTFKYIFIEIILEENFNLVGILPINNIPFINGYKKKYNQFKQNNEDNNIIEQFSFIIKKNLIEIIKLNKLFEINNKLFMELLIKNGCYIGYYDSKFKSIEVSCYIDFNKTHKIMSIYEKIIYNKSFDLGFYILKNKYKNVKKLVKSILLKLIKEEILGYVTIEILINPIKSDTFILKKIKYGKTIFQIFFDLIENINKKQIDDMLIVPYLHGFILNSRNEKEIYKKLKFEQLNYDFVNNEGVLLLFNKEKNIISKGSLMISTKLNLKKKFTKVLDILLNYEKSEKELSYLEIVKKCVNKFWMKL